MCCEYGVIFRCRQNILDPSFGPIIRIITFSDYREQYKYVITIPCSVRAIIIATGALLRSKAQKGLLRAPAPLMRHPSNVLLVYN